jgi:ubiquinone/menaquinone biosynthesis C-methylase UbiE
VGAGELLPFRENSFDSAMCLDAFGYFEKPALVVREIRRVLKPGGTMVINVEKGVLSEKNMRNMLLNEGLEVGEMSRMSVPEIEDKPVFLFAFARKKK